MMQAAAFGGMEAQQMMLGRSTAEINRIDFLVYLIQTPDRPVEFPVFVQIRREDSYMSKVGDCHFSILDIPVYEIRLLVFYAP
jgi:hypothetical protein